MGTKSFTKKETWQKLLLLAGFIQYSSITFRSHHGSSTLCNVPSDNVAPLCTIAMFSRPQHPEVPTTAAASMISLSDCNKGLYYLSDNRAGLLAYSALDSKGKLGTLGTWSRTLEPTAFAETSANPLQSVRRS